MYPYASAIGAYRCPANLSTVIGKNSVRRTRSYTLNGWMNSSQDDQGVTQNFGYTLDDFSEMPHKMSQIVRPSPVGTFVFLDEQEKSIDDGLWNCDPSALVAPAVAVLKPGASPQWSNLPADRHNLGANVAFA